jgi:hypothetical protein
MGRKKIQFFVFAVVVIIAGFTAWFLFQQSSRFKALEDQGREQQEANASKAQQEKPEFKIVHSANRTEEARLKQEAATKPSGQKTADANATLEPDQAGEDQERKQASWIKDFVVTSTFIQDLADYVIDHYQPPLTKDNPGEAGTITVSFKSLNARYGLELIGLRHSADNLKKAREEVLGKLMNPDLLREAYERYAQTFVKALVDKARETRNETIDGDLQTMTDGQIAEMLRLNSEYVDDVSAVLQVLARDPALTEQVEEYLRAEKKAVHANFVLNQEQNRYDVLTQSRGQSDESETVTEQKISQAESRKKKAAENYRNALQKREQARQKLLEMIAAQSSDVDLEQHEILYISEWVFRRLDSGQGSEAIEAASSLLDDLAGRFKARARALAPRE